MIKKNFFENKQNNFKKKEEILKKQNEKIYTNQIYKFQKIKNPSIKKHYFINGKLFFLILDGDKNEIGFFSNNFCKNNLLSILCKYYENSFVF